MKLKWLAIGLIVLLVISAYVHIKDYLNPKVITQKEYVKVPEIKTVTKIKRVPITVEKIITLDKEPTVKKLKLPEEIKTNPDKVITTTGEIKPSEAITDVVATLDTKTGESELIAKERPLPFLGLYNKGEIGFTWNTFHSKNLGDFAITYDHDFIRIGKVKGKLTAWVDTKGNWTAGLNARIPLY